jgi:hypothetical protein
MPKTSTKAQRSPKGVPDLPPKTVDADPRKLLLDPLNPRLPPGEKNKSQERIIELMIERFAIDEIAESICSAGFLPLDPFVGYRQGNDILILEGNRRLATIKLLLQPELVPKRHVRTWDDFRARLSDASRRSMESIQVLVFADRRQADVLAYIGYRHVNGVMSWDAEEKAAYIAQLVEDPAIKWSYSEIAQKLGSKPAYVEKLYVAHRLVEQAREANVPGAAEMRTNFGVLTRGLQSPGVVKFLGITFPHDPAKSRKPATSPARDLEDFVRWTFGTDEVKPVLEDSRDLTKWGQILGAQESVRYLRSTSDPRFDRAYAKSGGLKEGLVDALLAAADRLEEAVPLIRQHRGEEDVQRAVERCADFLVQILGHFPEIAQRQGVQLQDAPTP